MAAQIAANQRPRLKKLDDLFLLNDGANTLDTPATEKQQEQLAGRQSDISIERLVPFRDHPFHLYEGERLDDMVESIKSNGVLVPIIVRHVDNVFEILAGHNRVNAAKLAGFDRVPAIVLKNISDDEAWVYVIETNLMQRSFADMSHSEKAAVIATQHSKLFSQGKRNDIVEELQMLENLQDSRENGTSGQLGQKLDNRENVAKEYSLSSRTVARYQRIHQLISALKIRLDNGEISFIPAVTLSFLKEYEQFLLDKCLGLNCFKVDMRKADLLRQYSEEGRLDEDSIYLILSGEAGIKPKPNRTPTVKVSKVVYAKYFRQNQPAKEVQGIVEKALEFYYSHMQDAR